MCLERTGDVDGDALGRAQRRDDELAVRGGQPSTVTVEGDEGSGRIARGRSGRVGGVDDVDVVTQDQAHDAQRVAQAMAEIEGPHLPRRLACRCGRVEKDRWSVIAAEHPVDALGLRLGGHPAGGDRRGDPWEARQRRLVAAGVERERGLVVGDREAFRGHDVAAVDAGRHEVPGDGVLVLPGEQCPVRDVESGVLGQRSVMEVDAGGDLGQHIVGDDPQVGDREQDVGRVLVEAGGQFGAWPHDGDALLDGELADDRIGGGDEHHVEPVRPGDVDALRDERLVADHGAPDGSLQAQHLCELDH